MSTRSLTHVKDGDGKILVTFYRQSDGYPTGHGKDLAEFLKTIRLTNGISLSKADERTANGMGCLAAQLIVQFKDREPAENRVAFEKATGRTYPGFGMVGGVYLYPAGARNCGEEYTYTVSVVIPPGAGHFPKMASGSRLNLKCVEVGTTGRARAVLFDGDPKDFDGQAIEAARAAKDEAE